jgi:hypothetical protein
MASILLAVFGSIRSGLSWGCGEFGHRFLDRVTGVVFRIRFISGAVLRDLADHLLGVVTPRESALRESPVMFGLAKTSPGRRLWLRSREHSSS